MTPHDWVIAPGFPWNGFSRTVSKCDATIKVDLQGQELQDGSINGSERSGIGCQDYRLFLPWQPPKLCLLFLRHPSNLTLDLHREHN